MRSFGKIISAMTAVAAVTTCSVPATAATVINANWDSGCGKTTCINDNGVYTHAWSASDFSGPISVGQLLLDRSILGSLDGKMFSLSFQIDGQDVGDWGKFLMAGINGDTLSFTGNEFTWNPEDGDLVLVLALIPPPKAGAGGFAAFAPSGGGGGGGGTVFTQDQGGDQKPGGDELLRQVGGVPEPATWALMITGFGGAGAMLRRRRAALA